MKPRNNRLHSPKICIITHQRKIQHFDGQNKTNLPEFTTTQYNTDYPIHMCQDKSWTTIRYDWHTDMIDTL